MLDELLSARRLPDPLSFDGEKIRTADEFDRRRAQIRRLLENEEYGTLPPKPDHLKIEQESDYPAFCRGSATLTHYTATITLLFSLLCGDPEAERTRPRVCVFEFPFADPRLLLPARRSDGSRICRRGILLSRRGERRRQFSLWVCKISFAKPQTAECDRENHDVGMGSHASDGLYRDGARNRP